MPCCGTARTMRSLVVSVLVLLLRKGEDEQERVI